MKSHLITGVLVLMVLILSALFTHQGRALDAAIADAKEAAAHVPPNVVLTFDRLTFGERVVLGCSLGADVEGVSEYALTVNGIGKSEVLYGCDHVKMDLLTPAQ